MIPGSLGEVNDARLKTGKIVVRGKEVPAGGRSSYPKVVQIVNLIKEWIQRGKFLLSQPVAPIPGPATGYAFKSLKERPVE
ncbi:MAG: hypothetical protein KAJ81_00385 [Candidatus Latescibacteria bacterium]|nr:hypothetical protein [Candidatus Latescibacterota bacterium]